MVTHPRTAAGVNRLRPLNQPKPIKVQADRNNSPIAVIYKGRRIAIEGIKDRWRIDDEWWRKEISRLYYQIILKDGRIFTLFQDLVDGGWFTQSVTTPAARRDNIRVFVGQVTKKEQDDIAVSL